MPGWQKFGNQTGSAWVFLAFLQKKLDAGALLIPQSFIRLRQEHVINLCFARSTLTVRQAAYLDKANRV